jgi:hypothetical protein
LLEKGDFQLVPIDETALVSKGTGGFTSFSKKSSKYTIRLRKTNGVVLTAIRLGHELTHVQDDESLRKQALKQIVVQPVAGFTKEDLVEYAGVALLSQKFGPGAATGEEDFKQFLAEQIEQKCYRQMLTIQKEIAAKFGAGTVLDTGTVGSPEFNSDLLQAGTTVAERKPLEGAALVAAIRANRTDKGALKLLNGDPAATPPTGGLRKAWADKIATLPDQGTPGRDQIIKLLTQTSGDAKFELLLENLAYEADLIPPNLKENP